MKNLTEIVFILDKSGSMSGMEKDTIGGYNSFLEKQKKVEGDALVSTIIFSNYSTVLHDRVPIAKVEPLTENDYQTEGCTALLDAVGGAVHHIKNVHKYIRPEDVPEKTIFVITTDGMENASHEYSRDQVKKMITQMKDEKGWEFIFVAEDLDVVETAYNMGISQDRVAFYQASEDTNVMYDVMSNQISAMRCSMAIDADWQEQINSRNKDHRQKKVQPSDAKDN